MPDPRRDVTGLTPADQHSATLAVLDERTGMTGAGGWQGGRDLEGLAGRRRILERHAPVTFSDAFPALCDNINHVLHCKTWPCADYLDAAAGLTTGLDNDDE